MLIDILSKISTICWCFVSVFVIVLGIVSLIPTNFIGITAIIVGLLIAAPICYLFYKRIKIEGFDLGWFLVVEKGFWRAVFAIAGILLLVGGLLATFLPDISNKVAELHAMTIVKMLAALFWIALNLTFISWTLVAVGESIGYFRLRKIKSGFSSIGLAVFWLIFVTVFSFIFLEVINDVFVPISEAWRKTILLSVAPICFVLGIAAGLMGDFKYLENED